MTVPQGATLAIGPGQIIKCEAPAAASLVVEGTLNAQGTAAAPVIFTSLATMTPLAATPITTARQTGPASYDWGQIQFTSTSTGDVLDNVIVRYGSNYVGRRG